MDKRSIDIEKRLPESDGMIVPPGYFDEFISRMESSLPERPELTGNDSAVMPRSIWQRVRPYVYMAAMFAGVWCMLKVFTIFTATAPLPLESNQVLADAFSNEIFVNEYVISDVNQWDLYDDLMDDGIDPELLKEPMDFNEFDALP